MSKKPKLDEIKNWSLDRVRQQREQELQEHRANLNKRSYELAYHAPLTAHYRLGYMQWLLDGSPQPMPRFI